MRLKVNENGLVIPPSFLAGINEVEISREGDLISQDLRRLTQKPGFS